MIDVVVLFFLFGVVAGLARSELKLPGALYETLTVFLLLVIGLKGGEGLAMQPLAPLLHGIIVDQSNRRKGMARAVSTSLLETAYRAGARRAWLQVEVANTAAISLYASLGFSPAWSYHHLVRPM